MSKNKDFDKRKVWMINARLVQTTRWQRTNAALAPKFLACSRMRAHFDPIDTAAAAAPHQRRRCRPPPLLLTTRLLVDGERPLCSARQSTPRCE